MPVNHNATLPATVALREMMVALYSVGLSALKTATAVPVPVIPQTLAALIQSRAHSPLAPLFALATTVRIIGESRHYPPTQVMSSAYRALVARIGWQYRCGEYLCGIHSSETQRSNASWRDECDSLN